MKMIVLWTFACALTLSGFEFCWAQEALAPVETTLCQLYQHPERYAGKMIRVRGGSLGNLRIEDSLHDVPVGMCSAYMRLVVVLPDQVKPAPAFQLIRDESYRRLDEALHSQGPVRIDATYEGRFDPIFVWRDHKRVRVSGNQVQDGGSQYPYDGRIVLRRVSDVWTKLLPKR
jgi:hypothetical protein